MRKGNFWLYSLVAVCLLVIVGGILYKESRKWSMKKESVREKALPNEKTVKEVKAVQPDDGKSSAVEKSKGQKADKPAQPMKVATKSGNEQEFDKEVDEIVAKYKATKISDEKVDLLESLSLINNRKVLDLIYQALDDPDENVRIAAAALLEDFDSEAVIPIVAKALDDKNEEVRVSAINALDEVDSPEVTNLLVKGIGDNSEEVRDAVSFLVSDRDQGTKEAILKEMVKSKYDDVRSQVTDLAIDVPSHNTMEILLEALKDKDPDFRDEVNSVISFFVSEEFESYEEAKRWWEANKNRFDEELFETE
jgi:hypothetical protein